MNILIALVLFACFVIIPVTFGTINHLSVNKKKDDFYTKQAEDVASGKKWVYNFDDHHSFYSDFNDCIWTEGHYISFEEACKKFPEDFHSKKSKHQKEIKFCSYCQNKLSKYDMNCTKCGAPIAV